MCHNFQKSKSWAKSEYIFTMTEEPLDEWAVDYMYEKICKNLGISFRSSHKSRKTYISTLLDNGVNPDTVRALAGHTDSKTALNSYLFDRAEEKEKNGQDKRSP